MLSVNSMVRGEPLAYFAVMSVIDAADEIILVNTGPVDDIYFGPLVFLYEKFPEKVCLWNYVIDGDAHCWENKEKGLDKINEKAGKQLGDIRRWMHNVSRGDIFILDGDEIYPNNFAQYIKNDLLVHMYAHDNLVAAHFPFVDFLDKDHVRQYHAMGRVFKKCNVELRGDYPTEMHYNIKTNKCIDIYGNDNINTDLEHGFVYHYEHLVKPHRKIPHNLGRFTRNNGKHPEVFERHGEEFKKLFPELGKIVKGYGLI